MTIAERAWLQETRRRLRFALVKTEYGDWPSAVLWVKGITDTPMVTSATSEVIDMLASASVTDPRQLITNAAMRAAFIRRLEETKALIGEILVAATDR